MPIQLRKTTDKATFSQLVSGLGESDLSVFDEMYKDDPGRGLLKTNELVFAQHRYGARLALLWEDDATALFVIHPTNLVAILESHQPLIERVLKAIRQTKPKVGTLYAENPGRRPSPFLRAEWGRRHYFAQDGLIVGLATLVVSGVFVAVAAVTFDRTNWPLLLLTVVIAATTTILLAVRAVRRALKGPLFWEVIQ